MTIQHRLLQATLLLFAVSCGQAEETVESTSVGASDTASAVDSGVDTGSTDAGTNTPEDTGSADTNTAPDDTAAADTSAADTGAADTGAADTGAADTGTTTETDTSSGTDAGTPANELTVNGDFELGNISGWTDYSSDNNGTFAVVSKPVSGGSWAGNLVAKVSDNGVASFPVVKQANLGKGVVAPNDTIKISFDLYGEVAGVGHVVIAEFFSELADEGTSKTEILGGGPLLPTGANDWTKKWTSYSFTTTAGPDVNGGVTFQIKADCGPNKGCAVNLYIDNVSVSLK